MPSPQVWWVITAKMRCCIMLLYHDLLDSTTGVMSSLFGIVNLWIEVVLCFCNVLHDTQWTKIRWPSRGMGIVLSHSAIFCHPLSKWRTMLIRQIDKKMSIDQGLKLLREAKELLSGSLSDNIPLVNSTSIPNPNRSERIASNLRALFGAYDDSPASTRLPAAQCRNQIAGPPKTKGRHASMFFKPGETWTHEFLCLSCCRQEVVLLFNHVPSMDFEEKIEGL